MVKAALFITVLASCATRSGVREETANSEGTLFLIFPVEHAAAPVLFDDQRFMARLVNSAMIAFSYRETPDQEIAGVRIEKPQQLGRSSIIVPVVRQTLPQGRQIMVHLHPQGFVHYGSSDFSSCWMTPLTVPRENDATLRFPTTFWLTQEEQAYLADIYAQLTEARDSKDNSRYLQQAYALQEFMPRQPEPNYILGRAYLLGNMTSGSCTSGLLYLRYAVERWGSQVDLTADEQEVLTEAQSLIRQCEELLKPDKPTRQPRQLHSCR